jgi:hypothetical protein
VNTIDFDNPDLALDKLLMAFTSKANSGSGAGPFVNRGVIDAFGVIENLPEDASGIIKTLMTRAAGFKREEFELMQTCCTELGGGTTGLHHENPLCYPGADRS